MNHQDHVNLLRGGIPVTGGVWADFGAGTGAFTLALADLIGNSGTIYAVDQDGSALRQGERAVRERFPQVNLQTLQADFTQKLDLPPLDGIVMANALHFLRQKDAMVGRLRGFLKPDGRLLLVEYNVDSGNPWVPYPLSYGTWERMAAKNGFASTRLLATVPSRFLREIYSAVSVL